MFLFYFITGFIVIRIWIILIESQDIYIEIGGAAITLVLFIALCMRYRRLRRQAAGNGAGGVLDPNVIGGGDGRIYATGLSQSMIDMLRVFPYHKEQSSDYKNPDLEEGLPQESNSGSSTLGEQIAASSDFLVPSSAGLAEHSNENSSKALFHNTCGSDSYGHDDEPNTIGIPTNQLSTSSVSPQVQQVQQVQQDTLGVSVGTPLETQAATLDNHMDTMTATCFMGW